MFYLAVCLVQETRAKDLDKAALKKGVRAAFRERFGTKHRLFILWLPVSTGMGYSAGVISETTWCQVMIPKGVAASTRQDFLKALSQTWCSLSGQGSRQFMGAAMTREQASRLYQAYYQALGLRGGLRYLRMMMG